MRNITLTQGYVAWVSDKDYRRAIKHRWHAHRVKQMVYAKRGIWNGKNNDSEYLHQFILGVKCVDHKNGDGLDCRRGNLRAASKSQNSMSFQHKRKHATSIFRGVSWSPSKQKWRMDIASNGKRIFAYFQDETAAAKYYDSRAKKLFGRFGSFNFSKRMPEQYQER